MRYRLWKNTSVLRCVVVSLLIALPASSARAYMPEFPGSTWGNVSRDLDGIDGNGIMGNVTQGVDWFHLPYDIPFITYAEYSWRLRSVNKRYFDVYGPSLGVEIKKDFLTAGAARSWTRYPVLDEESNRLEAYLSWYKSWNWARRAGIHGLGGMPIKGLPLSSWGRLSHDLNSLEGDGTMGNISQGIDWAVLPMGVGLKTFAAYRWRYRTKNKKYFNVYGPSVGIEVSKGPIDIGADYSWRRFPGLDISSRSVQLYLVWYYSWNLKKKDTKK